MYCFRYIAICTSGDFRDKLLFEILSDEYRLRYSDEEQFEILNHKYYLGYSGKCTISNTQQYVLSEILNNKYCLKYSTISTV